MRFGIERFGAIRDSVIPFREREVHRMRPKKRNEKGTGDLFRARLDQIISMKHELVRLAEEIDWVKNYRDSNNF